MACAVACRMPCRSSASRAACLPLPPAGEWLCVKNLHLAVSWLPVLERELHALQAARAQGFRLLLTAEPHARFPPTLLAACTKVRRRRRHWPACLSACPLARLAGTARAMPPPPPCNPLLFDALRC
jgi:hypothetical protein